MTTHPDVSIAIARVTMAEREATAASRRLVLLAQRHAAPTEHTEPAARLRRRVGTMARLRGAWSA